MLIFEFSSIKFHTKICHLHVVIKILWYFDNILSKYQVSMDLDTIYRREISLPCYFSKLSIFLSIFLVFIGILLIFRLYFTRFWDDQHSQTPTKRFFIHCANRYGKFAPCYISCSKYIYTQIHHINIILKKCFKEQINYNYFIIKWNFFIFLNTKNIKIIVITFFIMFLISLIY